MIFGLIHYEKKAILLQLVSVRQSCLKAKPLVLNKMYIKKITLILRNFVRIKVIFKDKYEKANYRLKAFIRNINQ